MPDRVNAEVNRLQMTASDDALDLPFGQTPPNQLPPRHNAMLCGPGPGQQLSHWLAPLHAHIAADRTKTAFTTVGW